MDYIRGITFAPFAGRGVLSRQESRESLRAMKERTGADTVLFAPAGVQKTAQSVEIRYDTEHTMTDQELKGFITYAKSLGLRVFLKPTVNCLNGTWRAHINFFDEDVPCEPKWSEWFASYTKFQLHYAEIAQETECDMFIAGCEMVMAERREAEWRKLIADIKKVYFGPVSYNTDPADTIRRMTGRSSWTGSNKWWSGTISPSSLPRRDACPPPALPCARTTGSWRET